MLQLFWCWKFKINEQKKKSYNGSFFRFKTLKYLSVPWGYDCFIPDLYTGKKLQLLASPNQCRNLLLLDEPEPFCGGDGGSKYMQRTDCDTLGINLEIYFFYFVQLLM